MLLTRTAPNTVSSRAAKNGSRKGLDVEQATLTWVEWFNNRRLLQPIGDVPPAEYEMLYYRTESNEAV